MRIFNIENFVINELTMWDMITINYIYTKFPVNVIVFYSWCDALKSPTRYLYSLQNMLYFKYYNMD